MIGISAKRIAVMILAPVVCLFADWVLSTWSRTGQITRGLSLILLIVSWIVFLAVEAVLFWPIARQKRSVPLAQIVGGILLPLALPVLCLSSFFIFFPVLLAPAPFFELDLSQLPPWLFLVIVIFLMELALFAIVVMVKLADRNQRMAFQAWRIGKSIDWIAFFLRVVIWACALLGAADFVFMLPGLLTSPNSNGGSITADTGFLPFLVPVAVLAGGLHWLRTRPQPISHLRRILVAGFFAALAVGLFLSPVKLPSLAQLVILFALALDAGCVLSAPWKATLVGLGFGSLAAVLLAGPMQTLVYSWVRPGYEHAADGSPFLTNLLIAGIAGACFLAASGPLSVVWSRPPGWRGKLGLGMLSGWAAAMVLFGTIGGPAAGIISNAGLYSFALSRIGFGPAEWLFKLAAAINNAFPLIVGVFLLTSLGGLILGGLTGLLTPARPFRGEERGITFQPMPFFLTVFLLLAVIGGVEFPVLQTLAISLQHVFDVIGSHPAWHPDWMVAAVLGTTWLVMVLVQVGILADIQKWETGKGGFFKREIAGGSFLCGLIGLIFPAATLLQTASTVEPFFMMALLLTGVLGFETLSISWRLWRGAGEEILPSTDWAGRFSSAAAGGTGSAVIGHLFTAIALSMVLIAIVLIGPMAEYTKPAPGLSQLHILDSVFWVNAVSFNAALILGAAAGMLFSLAFTWGDWLCRILQWMGESLKGLIHPAKDLQSAARGILLPLAIGLAAAWIVVQLMITAPLVLALVVVLISFWTIRSGLVERLPRWDWALAFGIVFLGVVTVSLRGASQVDWKNAIGLQAFLVFMFGPALAVTSRAVLLGVQTPRLNIARMGLFLGMAGLSAIISGSGQGLPSGKGGLARFDGTQWNTFSGETNFLAGTLNFSLFQDSAGALWLGSGTGILASQSHGAFRQFEVTSDPFSQNMTAAERLAVLQGRMEFLEDRGGRLWAAVGNNLGVFDAAYADSNFNLLIPERSATRERLELPGSVLSMVVDRKGYLWAALSKGGVLRLDAHREAADSDWAFFSASGGVLPSDDIHALYADRAGNIWIGTRNGLVRFDGQNWTNVPFPGSEETFIAYTFAEGADGRLWAGSREGAVVWDGHSWMLADQGWPGRIGISFLFADSRGGIWASNALVGYRYDGTRWEEILPGRSIRAMDEDPEGVFWVGTSQGVIRYDLDGGKTETFNSENSALPADSVQDVLVDRSGTVWVSTFVVQTPNSYSVPAVVLAAMAFVCLFLFAWWRSYPKRLSDAPEKPNS
jgi:hypothetical protein